jgi:hypothetical protein
MKLRSVQTSGVLGVPDGTYDFWNGEKPHSLVVITGEEATGKTRLLEVIAAAREVLAPETEDFDQESFVRAGSRSAKAILSFYLNEAEQTLIGAESRDVQAEVIFGADPTVAAPDQTDPGLIYLIERYDHTASTSKLEYFAENRRLDVGGGDMSLDPETQQSFRTSKSPRKYAFVSSFMSSLPTNSERAVRFAQALKALQTTCSYDVDSQKLYSRNLTARSLLELSSSEADAVLIAATASLVVLSNSIILVDRPELYRHDTQDFVAGLLQLGGDNQVVVATTSSQLTGNDPSGCLIQLDARPNP